MTAAADRSVPSTDSIVAARPCAGSYRYVCDVPGHETVEGVLVVE